MTTLAQTSPTRRRRKPINWGRLLVHAALIVIGFVCVAPMMLIVSISLSDERTLALEGYSLLPVGFTTFAYEYVLQNPAQVLHAYGVTAVVTAAGTVVGLLLCAMLAYPLSRSDYRLRGPLSFYVFFTLLFNGGMVPFYILMTRYLGLKDNILALILPYLVTAWYVLILRTSFAQLPVDLLDAARIDGAHEFGIFWRIVLPLVRHNLAALAIIVFIFKYDDLLWPLVVAQRPVMYPVTVGLVEYVGQFFIEYHLFTTAAVLVIIPVFVIYLFLQRYIIEGIATQGLKG